MDFLLTKLTEKDWDFFKCLYTSSEVMQFISDPMSDEQIKYAFDSRLPKWDLTSSHWLCFVIRNKINKTPLGLTGLKLVHNDGEVIAEVGYIISPEYKGKSLATTSLTQLLSLKELDKLKKFQAVVTSGNIASEFVLKKNGFILTKIIENNYIIGNIAFDDHIYTLTR